MNTARESASLTIPSIESFYFKSSLAKNSAPIFKMMQYGF
jgi:hypothetical protein